MNAMDADGEAQFVDNYSLPKLKKRGKNEEHNGFINLWMLIICVEKTRSAFLMRYEQFQGRRR